MSEVPKNKYPRSKYEHFNVQYSPELSLTPADVEDMTARFGISKAALARQGLLLQKYWSTEFYKMLEHFADGLSMRPGTVIECIFLRRLAELEADSSVWGGGTTLLEEFTATPEGPIVGVELYERLLEQFTAEKVTERYETIKDLVSKGAPVTSDEKEFLEKYSLKI